MIVDSHVHVWVQQPEKYPWAPIGGYIPKTEAPIECLMDMMAANRVECAVLVQPTPYGWNNSYLLDSAKKDPSSFRSVCLVNPRSSQNADAMKKLVELHEVSGFRINWHLNPVSEWQNDPNHHLFWKTAAELNTPISIQCTLEYLPLLKSMCERFSNARVILDHLARFDPQQGVADVNFLQLLALSKYPNIFIKISGWNYCSRQSPPYADIVPFVQALLDAYGARRCLWGSDFPFIQEHWNYKDFVDSIEKNFSLSKEDLSWVLGKTARDLWW